MKPTRCVCAGRSWARDQRILHQRKASKRFAAAFVGGTEPLPQKNPKRPAVSAPWPTPCAGRSSACRSSRCPAPRR
ncbi:hypothetical protein [Lysobacter gummosus]|uniref:hypothetical protein n=1 Tax=Lysobacter gummosus TaxID=262324 RepID=UPI003635D978